MVKSQMSKKIAVKKPGGEFFSLLAKSLTAKILHKKKLAAKSERAKVSDCRNSDR